MTCSVVLHGKCRRARSVCKPHAHVPRFATVEKLIALQIEEQDQARKVDVDAAMFCTNLAVEMKNVEMRDAETDEVTESRPCTR
jgi:hypothetical protein